MNALHNALVNDPDLGSIPKPNLPTFLQSLFICTGCDFISFFKQVGKATFFNYFFQHAHFICGINTLGSLDETDITTRSHGSLAFLRLVGTMYFKKHLPSFVSLHGHMTPDHLFNSVDPSLDPHQRHRNWIDKIREVVSDCIQSEEDRVPSYTSLWRHWVRSCWVSAMWRSSHEVDVYTNLPDPHLNGWIWTDDDTYVTDWEDEGVQPEIEKSGLLKECKCKTKCGVRCGCRKKSTYCGPGCECHECQNLPIEKPDNGDDDDEDEEDDNTNSDSDNEDNEDNDMETEIITNMDYFNVLTTDSHIL